MPTPEQPGRDPAALTHVDATGAARMVDVSGKPASVREAVATGVLRTTAQVAALLRDGALPKGDALATARIAGIRAAKRTPDLGPLCHPIAISGVSVDLEVGDARDRGIRDVHDERICHNAPSAGRGLPRQANVWSVIIATMRLSVRIG